MVAASKRAVAHLANVRPRARVLTQMARQLVRARKLPLASLPGAGERPLARVCARVGLEVGALGVALVAALVLARVWTLFAAGAVGRGRQGDHGARGDGW
jgi:hypothetical protein